ncbi:MAG: Uroporphyrinogen-III synthase HemD, partial [Acidobacteria bacterium]|nr:Uroporphyrinogen-III synthase HemD [Acidobacteriota bacterium]
TFTSASTADNFFARLSDAERAQLLAHATLASIGPQTTDAIARYGRAPEIEAPRATVAALHEAIVAKLGR